MEGEGNGDIKSVLETVLLAVEVDCCPSTGNGCVVTCSLLSRASSTVALELASGGAGASAVFDFSTLGTPASFAGK